MFATLKYVYTAKCSLFAGLPEGMSVELAKEYDDPRDNGVLELQNLLEQICRQAGFLPEQGMADIAFRVFNLGQQLGGNAIYARTIRGENTVTAWLHK